MDPDPRLGTDTYYQCGEHHGVMKQEDKPEYQLPEGHELKESTLLKDITIDPDKDVVASGNFVTTGHYKHLSRWMQEAIKLAESK